jgi:hypothetical protein
MISGIDYPWRCSGRTLATARLPTDSPELPLGFCDEADDALFEDVNAGISRGSVGISTLVDKSTRHLRQGQLTEKAACRF